jgi:hypothetical protein
VKVFIQSKRGQIRNKPCEIACRGREILEAVRVFVKSKTGQIQAVRVLVEAVRVLRL